MMSEHLLSVAARVCVLANKPMGSSWRRSLPASLSQRPTALPTYEPRSADLFIRNGPYLKSMSQDKVSEESLIRLPEEQKRDVREAVNGADALGQGRL